MSASAISPNLRGALWMLASVAGATGMMICVRALSTDLPTAMIAFLRAALALPFLAPLLLRAEPVRLTRLLRPRLHLLRGALVALALNLGFFALGAMPLAEATTLFFLAPVFATALAPLLLSERVGPWRWAAVAAGFAGALIVLRPGAATLGPAGLSAAGSALCFALSLVVGKIASRADGADAVFASTAILAAILTLPAALPAWTAPAGPAAWAIALALAATSSLRTYADVRAFAHGEASFVAPVSYLRLPAIAAAAWVAFAEPVAARTWAGGAVIAAAAIAIALRERNARRAAAFAPERKTCGERSTPQE